MTKEELQKKILEIIQERTNYSEELKPETLFRQDLGLDSLGVLDLMLELEENFQLTISDEEAEKIKTIGDAVSYIHKNL